MTNWRKSLLLKVGAGSVVLLDLFNSVIKLVEEGFYNFIVPKLSDEIDCLFEWISGNRRPKNIFHFLPRIDLESECFMHSFFELASDICSSSTISLGSSLREALLNLSISLITDSSSRFVIQLISDIFFCSIVIKMNLIILWYADNSHNVLR